MSSATTLKPRRPLMRAVLRKLIAVGFRSLCDFEVNGRENLPASGPLLVIGNHFNFLDPVALIHILPWPLDFVGGLRLPNAPVIVRWIPALWGVLPVARGSVSRQSLIASREVLDQGGVLGIFPEGGSWATVLRPARPGAAYLASATQARILPIGLDGLTDVFPYARRGKRATVTVNIGQSIGPLYAGERGEKDRARLEEIGHRMMRALSELIPPERQGFYSPDPAVREAARGTEIYPWADVQEK